MLNASNSHDTTYIIDGIVCVVSWLLDACSIYIISILYPPIYTNWGVQKIFFARSARARIQDLYPSPIMKFVAPPLTTVLVLVLVVVTPVRKMPKALLIRNGKLRNLADVTS